MAWVVMQLIDPLALFVVLGGTMGAVLLSSPLTDCRRAVAALRPWWCATPADDAEQAARAVRQIRHILKDRGRVAAERVRTPLEFVHRIAVRLSECQTIDEFAEAERDAIDERAARHEAVIAVWRNAADAAPAMGMIGTVIGLTIMFGRATSPDDMAPALATAMLTTLYGLIISSLIAGPVATRLEQIALAEQRWQRCAVDKLADIARRDEQAQAQAQPVRMSQWRPDRARPAA